jgi:hypothetical protein
MLLPIGVLILLGMAGTVLYNQLAGLYNDAVVASRKWSQAYEALQEAVRHLPDPEEREKWAARIAEPDGMMQQQLRKDDIPFPLRESLLEAQNTYQPQLETVLNYHSALKRFPISAVAKAFKFAPLS